MGDGMGELWKAVVVAVIAEVMVQGIWRFCESRAHLVMVLVGYLRHVAKMVMERVRRHPDLS
jgi:hypothetical protein